MIAQGGIIALLGMAVVFAFLALLVGVMKLLSLASPGTDPTQGPADRRIVAAIAAACAAGEPRKGE